MERGRPSSTWVTRVIGGALIVLGLVPPIHGFTQFVRAGGTPMPGAMTTKLVVTGFNRYVRNPIYLGALTAFLGETNLLWHASLLAYAMTAWLDMAAFVHWYEEPSLVHRFGAEYEAYRHAVPAWLPEERRASVTDHKATAPDGGDDTHCDPFRHGTLRSPA